MAIFNPLASFNQGLSVAQNQQATQRQNQITNLQNALSGQIQQGGFNPAQSQELQQLSAIDPRSAAGSLSIFQELDDSRQKAFFQDARNGREMLEKGDFNGFLDLTANRLDAVQKLGGDPSDVMSVMQTFNSGDIQGTINQLKSAEQAGMQITDSKGRAFLSDPLDREAKQKRLAGATRALALSESEKNFNRITGLRQQLSSAEKSGDGGAIKAAQQQLRDFQQISGKFGLGAQEKSDIKVSETANKELSKQAAIASKDAFDSMKKIRTSIGNMTDAIRSINKGADTGPIISKLPSFRESTIELDNIRGKMGLDIVGATTFGALSESELKFALDVALPDKLEPEPLREWLNRKRDAQRKLAKELLKAATFLGKPGNTISKYIEKETDAGRLSFDPVAGEDDITKISDQELLSF